uniref:KHA domain-containing protein n=1 Tax=Pan troglodytes TaxID=9598 RepID=A0A2I3REN4_PANTR
MRRVTLFLKGSPKNGNQVVAVYGTLSDLLSVASSKLGIKATSVYNGKGGRIDDIALIRDDDVLFVCEGESFIDPQTDSKPPEGLLGFHTDWLTLNVGGRYFTTTRITPTRFPEYFEPILNSLRHGQLIVNDGINLLGVILNHRRIIHQYPERNLSDFLLATPTKSELRLLNCANLQGVKMLCSNAEGASLKLCNFEDPSGLKANLEGANLKGVDMEGSQMTGINLRVATLKDAKLKNCNLRGATLAGTDLENCDLSGCDLQEANLRGSNVKGAVFEEMLTPLHMSQSVR